MYTGKAFTFIAILSILFFSCIKDVNNDTTINYVNTGDQVPSFTVEDATGNLFNSNQLLGKQSLLVFFGTYCPDCKLVLPVIEEVWENMKNDSKFQLVAISRRETADTVSEYWKENQHTMPFYLDPKGEAFALFANNTIPRIYVINPDNKVVWMSVESLDLTAGQLIEMIRGL